MKKTIRDYDLNNKKVIIRVDFNVPIIDGVITDDTRIKESLKTINYAVDNGAKVILLSHLGRIKSEEDKKDNTLLPVSVRLSELLNKEVIFINETRGIKLEDAINNMNSGDVLLVENTRYEDLNNEAESKNSEELGKYWASLGDLYINDAFGTAHRAHASNVGIASNLDSGIGFLIEKELNAFDVVLNNPKRPLVVILGGAKVKDKIGLIDNLVTKADKIIITGGMSYTFLKSLGYEIGNSLLDSEKLEYAKDLLTDYKDKILLPTDVVVTDSIDNPTIIERVNIDSIPNNLMGVDIGSNTINNIKEALKDAKTVVLNGPAGVFEKEEFSKGTKAIYEILSNIDATTIIGGGDSASAANNFGYSDKVTHISTGGGASLELLEGKTLPGIACINDN
jgi:phosphoglycerate kinase